MILTVFLLFFLSTLNKEKKKNSNYFTSASKCRREKCIIDFTSAKMEFASLIFKKMYFYKYSIKRYCK